MLGALQSLPYAVALRMLAADSPSLPGSFLNGPGGAQVGNLTLDHAFYGPPEALTATNMPRPAYVAETTAGASDLAGSVSGALAAAAMVVKQSGNDPTRYNSYLAAAVNLYNAVRALHGAAVPARAGMSMVQMQAWTVKAGSASSSSALANCM